MPINTNFKTKTQRGTKCVKDIFFTFEGANRVIEKNRKTN